MTILRYSDVIPVSPVIPVFPCTAFSVCTVQDMSEGSGMILMRLRTQVDSYKCWTLWRLRFVGKRSPR